MPKEPANRRRRWRTLLLVSGIVLAIACLILLPSNIPVLSSQPNPVQSYAEAMRRIETLRTREPAAMNPVCRLQLMTHDRKVDRAIILVHGYTKCPQEFHELGQRLHDLGYNVLIAPFPHHGLADRMTEEHARLTAQELVDYANETVDIAQGLGERVTMMGISAGGVTTAWAAQHRRDIDLAVIISPPFGLRKIPRSLTAAAVNLFALLPNSFHWWDPVLQADAPPQYTYPRNASHALVQALRLGFAVRASARHEPPAANRIVVVFNASDNSISNAATMEVVRTWQAHGADLTLYEFEAGLKLDHDMIDPGQSGQSTDIVYPRLIDLIRR